VGVCGKEVERFPSAAMDRALRIVCNLVGALLILLSGATPFLRRFRARYGTRRSDRSREFPGDDLIAEPRWSWCHAIELDAACAEVFPWLVQMGQDKAGFYSHEWLENLAGCEICNAQSIHPEWQRLRVGDAFRLAPQVPPLRVVRVEPNQSVLVASPNDAQATARVTWLFFLEPLPNGGSRLFSRYRASYPRGLRNQLLYGPALLEPIGFVMDCALLRGIKRRVEAI
jgi:hypothetical protein